MNDTTTSYDTGFAPGDLIRWAPDLVHPADPDHYVVVGPAAEGWVMFTPAGADPDDVRQWLEAAPDELVHAVTSHDDVRHPR